MDIVGSVHFGRNNEQQESFQIQFNESTALCHEEEYYYILCVGLVSPSPAPAIKIAQKILNGSFTQTRDEIECSVIFIDKIKKRCLVMIDPLGCHPIYYAVHQNTLFFANKQRHLMQQISVPWKLNHQFFFELFHLGLVTPPDTLISNLYSIPVTHYLEYHSKVQLHEFVYNTPEKLDYQIATHMDLLKISIEQLSTDQIHLLCSGGLDSSLLLAASAGLLNKEVILHTVAFDQSSLEYQKTQNLQHYFSTRNHYFNPHPEEIFTQIDASILAGESEMVGTLSMNAAVEYSFAHSLMQHTFTLMTGDDNGITPATVKQQPPGYYHLKYGLLLPNQSKQLLVNSTSSMLTYVNKSKGFFVSKDKHQFFKAQRLLMHSTMIGKIIAKYRIGLHTSQRCIMPLNTMAYRQYIDSLNYHHATLGYNYRNSLQELGLRYQLLPKEFFKQPKQWMPSVWNLPSSPAFLNQMYQQILEDQMIKELFHYQQLPALLIKKEQTYNTPILLAFYYLIKFYKLFQLRY